MSTTTILVTGAGGQLGSELRLLAASHTPYHFIFTDVNELDITDPKSVNDFFAAHAPQFCINCAAYTAVDKAEGDRDRAHLLNATAVEYLAKACTQHQANLIQISTDFVFDGRHSRPIAEDEKPEPISVYGATKLAGELAAMKHCASAIVLRTSWLYSSFGNNFVKTMLRLGRERSELGIIGDQIGSPTYAADLAEALMAILAHLSAADANRKKSLSGIYHFSNQGVASWYDFAMAIFEYAGVEVSVKAIPTEAYPTPARRPHYSVMDKRKIVNTFDLHIPHWRSALKRCISLLEQN